MAYDDSGRFAHITVTSAEDDDVVIQAGAYEDRKSEAVETASDSDAPAADEAAGAVDDAEVDDADGQQDEGGYETTLEDIESSKMSLMQKVIIVIAVIVLIAFVVYVIVK